MTCPHTIGSDQFNPTTFPYADPWDLLRAHPYASDVPPAGDNSQGAEPVSPVDEVIADIAREQASTYLLLTRLASKLENILVERLGDASGEDSPACPTPLLQMLEARRQTAYDINERLRSITDRIVL